jgi:hypothetical protein
MYVVYKDDGKYVVELSVPLYIFWTKKYQYICETEEDVKNLVIPHDKMFISDEVPISVHPKLSSNIDATYWSCIMENNKIHQGEIRVA